MDDETNLPGFSELVYQRIVYAANMGSSFIWGLQLETRDALGT
jgi:hypothetical protein